MNKGAIQKFAIWARNELIAQVSQRAYQYGIDESGFGDASADTLNGRLLTAEEKSQRQELIKQIKEKGYTLVPLQVYFKGSLVKVEIGLARGKKLYDKRQDIAKKDQRREAERDFKVKNLY